MIMKRLHSLDAMRAVLMLIGIYFHLAHVYSVDHRGWGQNRETVSVFFDLFILATNYFRMHAFFLISGFFGALLYYRKGVREMILNRFKRIFLPLIVMIWPIYILNDFSKKFSEYQAKGLGFFDSLSNSFSAMKFIESLPWSTLHLWFLNFLFFMSIFAFIVKYIYDRSLKNKNPKQGYFGKIIALLFTKQWLGTFLFCFFFGMLMALMGKQKAQGADHWWEWLWFFYSGGIKSFIAFGFFYFIGWHIYGQRTVLDKISIKNQIFIFIVFYALAHTVNMNLLKYQYSPYPETNHIFTDHIDKYRPQKNVTFSVDMSQFDFTQFEKDKSEFRGVFLLGTFNHYCEDCDKMEDEDGDLIYTKTIKVRKGIQKYIFSINGWEMTSTPTADSECDAAPGHKYNIYAMEVLDQDVVLDTVCWQGDCSDCSGNQIYNMSLTKSQNLKRDLIIRSYKFLFNFMVPCFIMLLLSLFVKLYHAESKRMRYVSDASYWVYIIHIPLTHFIPGLFHQSNMNVFLKFTITSIIITFICLFSYHYLVRSTFIGEFLNGRKYSNK
tara:strand:+ start:402 stop:2054 length:1653 start_codon:yes stop_codon:yes gene_type:complete